MIVNTGFFKVSETKNTGLGFFLRNTYTTLIHHINLNVSHEFWYEFFLLYKWIKDNHRKTVIGVSSTVHAATCLTIEIVHSTYNAPSIQYAALLSHDPESTYLFSFTILEDNIGPDDVIWLMHILWQPIIHCILYNQL